MTGNSSGPWGGGGKSGGGGDRGRGDQNGGGGGGGRRPPPEGPQIPEIDELVKKGQEQLRVLMGGKGGDGRTGGGGGGGTGGSGPLFTRGTIAVAGLVGVVLWGMASFYTVRPEQQSVELMLGKFSEIGTEGLNFAPWPLVTAEVLNTTTNRTEDIGVSTRAGGNEGLMLTTDENIVDIDFQVVWNIKNAQKYLFALQQPEITIRSVSEAVMREAIAQSELAPILNRDRGLIEQRVTAELQRILDLQDTGINVLRVNVNKVDPPEEMVTITGSNGQSQTTSVVDAFRDVQAAEQERDQLERQADAYANQRLAEARGESARLLEAAEGYRARVVNDAVGEASRFVAVLQEYQAAPEVTRKRLYLETMEKVYGDVDKIILEQNLGGEGGQGVIPYLPLNELRRSGGSN